MMMNVMISIHRNLLLILFLRGWSRFLAVLESIRWLCCVTKASFSCEIAAAAAAATTEIVQNMLLCGSKCDGWPKFHWSIFKIKLNQQLKKYYAIYFWTDDAYLPHFFIIFFFKIHILYRINWNILIFIYWIFFGLNLPNSKLLMR